MNEAPHSPHAAQRSPEHGRRGVLRIGPLLRAPSDRTSASPARSTHLPFGKVVFGARDHLGLTNDAFLLADVISSLAKRSGWCYASSEYLAATIGISTRHLRRHLRTLLDAGLVEQRRERGKRQLRTTTAWEVALRSAQEGQNDRRKRTICPPDKTSIK